MNKRTFMKTSSALITGAALSPLASCATEKTGGIAPIKNWAGNLTYSTKNVHYPTTVDQISNLVKKNKSLRGLGSQHSFSTIADSKDGLISLKNMKKIVSIDKTTSTVTVEAGVRYGDICEEINQNGFAFHNLASLPHISIVGAAATATHGSGVENAALPAAIRAIEFVNAKGEVIQLSREKDGDLFNGTVVSLGAFGIITKATLDIVPSFNMQQVVYRDMPINALEANFEEIMSSAYSVSLFTDWRNKNVNEVWIKSRLDAPEIISGNEYFGSRLADRNLHPIESEPAENCTDQMAVEGPWYERLPHFKMGFTPSSGDELQSEFFIPFENGYEAMMAIEKMNEQVSPHLLISEIRTIAEDNFWMSPFYKKPCVAIHFTWKPHWDDVHRLLPLIEGALAPFGVRQHWGKLTTLDPSVLQSRIVRLNDFKEIVNQFDPEGKFRNAYLEHYLYS